MPYVAGHWTAKYSPTSSAPSYTTIGSTQDGFTIHVQPHQIDVHDDAFAEAPADTILASVSYAVSGLMIELDKLLATTPGVLFNQELEGAVNANAGLLGSSKFGTLQLTPVPGTPAAAMMGAGNSYFFWLAGVSNDIDILLGNKLATANLHWKCLPSAANSGKAYGKAATV